MSKWPEDYDRYVLEEIKKSGPHPKTKKAGLIERYTKRHCPPKDLHPNPSDEFSQEKIGPNFEIIGKYTQIIRSAGKNHEDIFESPVQVEKLVSDGYLLLNGHHRWFAALRMGVPKIHIQIVDLVHEEDINRMLQATTNEKIASFDLDEVLLTAEESAQETVTDPMFAKRIRERLRKGAPDVIRALQYKGYDVWVYTSGYYSEEYIVNLFSMYEIELNGIVNGVNEKKRGNAEEMAHVRQLMASKYKFSLHIDNSMVLCVNPSINSFKEHEIAGTAADWSKDILRLIPELP